MARTIARNVEPCDRGRRAGVRQRASGATRGPPAQPSSEDGADRSQRVTVELAGERGSIDYRAAHVAIIMLTARRQARVEGWAALVGLFLLAALAALLVIRLSPPAVVPNTAPPEVFSAERARVHVEAIARTPHPSGSPAARAVEAYLVAVLEGLGLRVEVQAAPACAEAAGLRRCGHVRNVIATLPGRVPADAVLLSAHYDSVANAPGAGDDAAAVAALLETARALTHAGPLEHDVIFALLDGEEDLLLGSVALCGEASQLARVRLVANFDARGSRGPVTLIGASRNAGAAIDELVRVAPYPVLSSFYPSVARVLPNATDAEVYERCGQRVLSFAFADGFENYHQGTDDPEHLDERSLQHHGGYALALARRFASADVEARSGAEDERVFFDVGSVWVVRYSEVVARLLALGLLLVTGGVLVGQVRSRRVALSALVGAGVAYLGSLVAAVVVGALVVEVVTPGWGYWSAYRHAGVLAGCAACFVSAGYLLLAALARRRWAAELGVLGPLLVWVGLASLSALLVPGMSHLFMWPAAALLAGFVLRQPGVGGSIAAYALLVPAVFMLTPVIYTLVVVMGAPGASGAMACVALLLGACNTPLRVLAAHARRVSALLFAAGVVVAGLLNLQVRSELAPPAGNSVGYAVDSNARRARWVSADPFEDDWKRQFLGAHPERGRLAELPPERPLLMNAAPFVALEPPVLELVSDIMSGSERTLVLSVRSPRAARSLIVWEATGVQFSAFRFDESAPFAIVRFTPELDQRLFRLLSGLGDGGLWSATLFSTPPQGSRLALSTRHRGALELRSADRSEGLAVLPSDFVPRSERYTQGYPGDHTLVSGTPLRIATQPMP
jgi:Peptidase family M28